MEFAFKNVQDVTILIQSEKNNVIETLTIFPTKERLNQEYLSKRVPRVGKRKMN